MINPSVLRCNSPPFSVGNVALRVVVQDSAGRVQAVSASSKQRFWFRGEQRSVEFRGGKRQHDARQAESEDSGGEDDSCGPSSKLTMHEGASRVGVFGWGAGDRAAGSRGVMRTEWKRHVRGITESMANVWRIGEVSLIPVNDASGCVFRNVQLTRAEKTAPFTGTDRESKIRIVEKLGEIESSFSRGGSAGAACPTSNPNSQSLPLAESEEESLPAELLDGALALDESDRLHLLDDNALAELPDAELEVVLDKLLMRVVERMVQLAATDQDLADELNAPDRNGFCLLHYCALYNLATLVPLLFARGAHINCVTAARETPLHLAASGGHLALVQSLIESGADCDALDSLGLTPAGRAFQSGHLQVCEWISTRSSHDPMSSFGALQQQQLVTEAEHDALSSPQDKTQQLLQDAFSSLSLHEKCALSMSLKVRAS